MMRVFGWLLAATGACAAPDQVEDTAVAGDKDVIVKAGSTSTAVWHREALCSSEEEVIEGEVFPYEEFACPKSGSTRDPEQWNSEITATAVLSGPDFAALLTDAELYDGAVAPPTTTLPFPFVAIYDELTQGVNMGCGTPQFPQAAVLYPNHTDVTRSVWITFPIPPGNPTQIFLQTWYQTQTGTGPWTPQLVNVPLPFGLTGTEPTGSIAAFCYAQIIQTNNPFSTFRRERTATQHIPPGFTIQSSPYPMALTDVNGVWP